MKNVVCFDLEGPLSPQDNAYELMGLFENGYKIFEVLSRYDDILTFEGRRNYEPGDTLSLIIPFLVYHNISEDDIVRVSERARIVDGVKRVLSRIKGGWSVYVISTSYSQHALNIARQVGISKENVYSTKLPLDVFYKRIDRRDLEIVGQMQEKILGSLSGKGDQELKAVLDEFYKSISKTSLGILSEVKVVGGVRKLNALREVVSKEGKKLSEVVVVGDSITDFKMLEAVKNNNGVAVVFNGNKFALPYGNVGLACSSMMPILAIFDAFASGGARKVFEVVLEWQKNGDRFLENLAEIHASCIPDDLKDFLVERSSDRGFLKPTFSSLLGLSESERQKLVEIHSKARKQVRGEAGKLG
ncbi:MAG: hypothetical protein FJY77_03390 [Candidatus Altiarchaeales archaeon]|nr:hypothetical protein [Candidatus Altiarchaeales archaeon]